MPSMLLSLLSCFGIDKGAGIVQLVCSVILSRGVQHVTDDMDTMGGINTLIGRHGYAAQVG